MPTPKIPLNFFGIPFGLAGLGEAWTIAAGYHRAPAAVGEIICLLSAAAWLVVLGAYLRHLVTDRGVLARDLVDPVAAPFASLALITPMLLAALALHPHAGTAGRVVTDVFLMLTVLLGAGSPASGSTARSIWTSSTPGTSCPPSPVGWLRRRRPRASVSIAWPR